MPYTSFIRRFPQLGETWLQLQEAGVEGPLELKSRRLIQLAFAMGAQQEETLCSVIRKALAAGVTEEEFDQLVVLCAGAIGLPNAVRLHALIREVTEKANCGLI